MTTKEQEVYRAAERLYRQNPDWVSFFRDTFGVNGIVRNAYTQLYELVAFEQTYEYSALQLMVAKLRERGNSTLEQTRVITVRLPQSLHDSLRVEAYSMQTSMNKLCISKLLQIVDIGLVPADGANKAERDAEPVEID